MQDRLRILAVATVIFVNASAVAMQKDQATTSLREVLETRCHSCHGETGKAEGGFYALNYRSLMKHVVAGSPEESRLFEAVYTGKENHLPHSMPKDGPPLTAHEQDLVYQWISSGADDFLSIEHSDRSFVSASSVFEAVHSHLKSLKPEDRTFARYLSLHHLYNAEFTQEQLETYSAAISKLVNSLSRANQIVSPKFVNDEKTVLHIDLRHYQWTPELWDRIAERDPYAESVDSPSTKFCIFETKANRPLIRADWFVFAASRPPLYHDILQVPLNLQQLQQETGLDFAKSIEQFQATGTGFSRSGISTYANRVFLRFDHPGHAGGYVYVSRDFAENLGSKNIFAEPINHHADGGEVIISLPNGLQYYMLVGGDGQRIDTAPTNIVVDPSQRGAGVVNGISCFACHSKGLIPKRDEVRDAVLANADAYPKSERDGILAIYKSNREQKLLMQTDQQRFLKAVVECGVENGASDPIAMLSRQFEEEVDIYLAAAELGLKMEDLQQIIGERLEIARILGTLKIPGRTVKREVFLSVAKEHFLQPQSHSEPNATVSNADHRSTRSKILLWMNLAEGAAKEYATTSSISGDALNAIRSLLNADNVDSEAFNRLAMSLVDANLRIVESRGEISSSDAEVAKLIFQIAERMPSSAMELESKLIRLAACSPSLYGSNIEEDVIISAPSPYEIPAVVDDGVPYDQWLRQNDYTVNGIGYPTKKSKKFTYINGPDAGIGPFAGRWLGARLTVERFSEESSRQLFSKPSFAASEFITALQKSRQTATAEKILIDIATSESSAIHVREATLSALGKLPSQASKSAVQKCINQSVHTSIASAAMKACAELKATEAIPVIADTIVKNEPATQLVGIYAIKTLALEGTHSDRELAKELLEGLLVVASDQSVREAIEAGIAAITPRQRGGD